MENGNTSAFPWQFNKDKSLPNNTGLTKRELLAGMAMQGILAGMYADENVDHVQVDFCAQKSIQYADELLHQLSLSEGKK